ncbi:polcalcin Cyn d 7-like protein [Carex littledalei]|uniref:Polcalcin Cyn d 7-like protein n=1 Tax=Carex littledalei TaxID=544730 RepID=A0A833VXC2_9POAL|nr:polcalcin Cyn d 7-like protein [Carex littledalei]
MTIECSDPGHHPHRLFHHNHFKRMTREEFDKWLDDVDSNKDGMISQKELYAALKVLGLHMKTLKSWIAIKAVDRNRNKVIDGSVERKLLVDYAAKHWGIIVCDNF